MMKKAAIAVDHWKLPIFERHLTEAGYVYERGEGFTEGTLTLYVQTTDLKLLEKVVRTANAEAAAWANWG